MATGQYITPMAVKGSVQQHLNPKLPGYPDFVAGEAVRSQLSPDGATLAILCAGQNSLYKPDGNVDTANSTQYIFLYDVRGAHKKKPALLQVIKQTNAFNGLVFSPDGKSLYATGGADDAVYVYAKKVHAWAEAAKIDLGHKGKGIGINVKPNAGGLAISADGKTLVAANNYNDSISVIDTRTRTVRYEHDLRPYFAGNEGIAGGVGGTFPFAVVMKGNGTAYVSSDRDREVVVVDISTPAAGRLLARIALEGNGLGMTYDAARARLYVAQDNADKVAVIDTANNTVIANIDARAPADLLGADKARYTGVATFAVTLSHDKKRLYAVNSAANSIAVIPLTGAHANAVAGLIPTAYEPHDITFSADGSWMYIVNGKNATGPNVKRLGTGTARMTTITYPGGNAAAANASKASNQYQFQLERASLISAPVPALSALPALTQIVARNNLYVATPNPDGAATMAFLHEHIKHVIYVIKENRTYDQVLGDLGNGANGDPSITQFGWGITPNNHRLATGFVTLDNFTNPGDGSMDGWSWALQGRVTNTEALTQQINYAAVNRGLSFESEGENRHVAAGLPTTAERDAAAGPEGSANYSKETAALPGGTGNVLAGAGNHASSDAPFGTQKGYIFSAALQAGLTVRNYGFMVMNTGGIGTKAEPLTEPFAKGVQQVRALHPQLVSLTDPYFRGFDQQYSDLWRFQEWKREFDQYVKEDNLPNLSLVRISHDHMGSFGSAFAGIDTPETQQADCDLALGLLMQTVAASRYAADTVIMVIEDDDQDGPDHVDSHRGPALVVGPYVKHGAIISKRYSQVNVLRTIEDILGTQHLNLNTAYAEPMADVFDATASPEWTYKAVASTMLKTTALALEPLGIDFAPGPDLKPKHVAAYWDKATVGYDFSKADRAPVEQFNKVLWAGLKGRQPYPALRGQPVKKAVKKDMDDDDDDDD